MQNVDIEPGIHHITTYIAENLIPPWRHNNTQNILYQDVIQVEYMGEQPSGLHKRNILMYHCILFQFKSPVSSSFSLLASRLKTQTSVIVYLEDILQLRRFMAQGVVVRNVKQCYHRLGIWTRHSDTIISSHSGS